MRRKHFFSDDDIVELLAAVEALRPQAGVFARDAHGVPQLGAAPWTTVYLHTGGGFAERCPRLRAKLLAEAAIVDRGRPRGNEMPSAEAF